MKLKTILCPTDFSATSAAAYRVAADMARDYGAELLILHAWQRPSVELQAEVAFRHLADRFRNPVQRRQAEPHQPAGAKQHRGEAETADQQQA